MNILLVLQRASDKARLRQYIQYYVTRMTRTRMTRMDENA